MGDKNRGTDTARVQTNTHPSDQTPSDAVIEAVATHKGIDSTGLTDPLCEAIDPDALDMACRTSAVHITFEYHGCLVTVDDENQVELTELPH